MARLYIRLRYAALLAALCIALTGGVLWSAWLDRWSIAMAAFAASAALAAGGLALAIARSGSANRSLSSAAPASASVEARLASVTHDLRSPLNACLLWVNVLALQPSPEKTAEAVEALTRNLKKQAELLDALVDDASSETPNPPGR